MTRKTETSPTRAKTSSEESRGRKAAIASDLTAECKTLLKRFNAPAIGLARIVASGIESIGCFGERVSGSGIAVTEQDFWHIGSCTKSMTATLLARSVERGELAWDASLAPVLAQYGYDLHPDFAALTLRHLLTHRAGMPTDPPASAMDASASYSRPEEQRAAFAQAVLSEAPFDKPGKAEFRYSNLGYIVAGALNEAMAGTVWEDLMRRELFAPLGLATAGFGAPGKTTSRGGFAGLLGRREVTQPWGHYPESRRAAFAKLDPNDAEADGPAFTGPAGTAHLSLPDFARYVAYHVSRGGIAPGHLKPKTLDYLHAPLGGEDYALGWYAVGPEVTGIGKSAMWHEGTNNAWYAGMLIIPEDRRGLAWVFNTCTDAMLDPGEGMVATALRDLYADWEFKVA